MPGVICSLTQAQPRLLVGSDKKRVRRSLARQNRREDTSWSPPRWGRAAPHPRPRIRGDSRAQPSPENAARERSRVRTLRRAFLALQAALPTVPPHTKLSRLDVLVLATSYIAHLTRTLDCELPGHTWSPFLRGLSYLHPLKKWPMRVHLYAGGLGDSSLDAITATTSDPRAQEAKGGTQVSVPAGALLPTSTPLSAPRDK